MIMDWNGTIVVEMGFILDSNTSLEWFTSILQTKSSMDEKDIHNHRYLDYQM
jgi:hypothetical protein